MLFSGRFHQSEGLLVGDVSGGENHAVFRNHVQNLVSLGSQDSVFIQDADRGALMPSSFMAMTIPAQNGNFLLGSPVNV